MTITKLTAKTKTKTKTKTKAKAKTAATKDQRPLVGRAPSHKAGMNEANRTARRSPYQNAKPASAVVFYPPILCLGNRNDDRVHPAHARKMVAHLRALGHAKVWLYEEIAGGHSGRTDPSIFARREALLYSFLFRQLTSTA